MALAILQKELINSAADPEGKIGVETVFVQRDGKNVAAIVPMSTYETTPEAKAQRAVDALWAFREHMQAVATPEELEALEKELHQLAR